MLRLANATTIGGCRGRPVCRAALTMLVAMIASQAPMCSVFAQSFSVDPGQSIAVDPLKGASKASLNDMGEPVEGHPTAWMDGPTAPVDPDMAVPPAGWYGAPSEVLPEEFAAPGWSDEEVCSPGYYLPALSWFGLRQSTTHGRDVGVGWPLVGTSWLNRPYYFGGELGTIWMTRAVEDSVSKDIDTFGGIFIGWDWDHYWGSELKINRATPELINAQSPDAQRNDVIFAWSYSNMYYPWGDTWVRPYWRWGIGNTKFDFPLDNGSRHDEWLFTFPVGIGVKYPIRRWLAARAELTDYVSIGQNGIPTQNNITFTFGLEMHIGVRTKSYWPWNPSRHIW